jgi:hypothetical protein
LPLIALAALFLGTINASGRSTATTTITVEVMGVGKVTSDPSGIKCGNGDKKCYIAYSTTGGSVTLKASPAGGWDDGDWNGPADTDCIGPTSVDCTISLDGSEHIATANFTKSSGTSQSTLNVTYDDTAGDGHVTAPERDTSGNATTPGTEIDCGSVGPTTGCSWTVLTGSTLTLFESPDTGNVFTGWGGACSGTATGEACTVEMSGDKSVGAAWALSNDTVQLTVNIVGSG